MNPELNQPKAESDDLSVVWFLNGQLDLRTSSAEMYVEY